MPPLSMRPMTSVEFGAVRDRFGNDPRRLPAHRRAEQCHYQGSVIKNWSEPQPAAALREAPPAKKGNE